MRKASLFAALAGALVFAAAGSAITNGVPDGNAHPEVGALLATHAFPDGTWEECTGTLISSRIFLTAEHCDLLCLLNGRVCAFGPPRETLNPECLAAAYGSSVLDVGGVRILAPEGHHEH